MAINDQIVRIEHLARLIIGELIAIRPSNHERAEHILRLRCDLNTALCEIYRFAMNNGDTFEYKTDKARFCIAIDSIKDLLSNAITHRSDKIRHLDPEDRILWARSVDRSLSRSIMEIRRQLNVEQMVLSCAVARQAADPIRANRATGSVMRSCA